MSSIQKRHRRRVGRNCEFPDPVVKVLAALYGNWPIESALCYLLPERNLCEWWAGQHQTAWRRLWLIDGRSLMVAPVSCSREGELGTGCTTILKYGLFNVFNHMPCYNIISQSETLRLHFWYFCRRVLKNSFSIAIFTCPTIDILVGKYFLITNLPILHIIV